MNGVVHAQSNYATAFAAVGKPIPVCLTAIADEFGTAIPCAGYVRIGDQVIGEEVARQIGSSPAILLKQHSVVTIVAPIQNALKAKEILRQADLVLPSLKEFNRDVILSMESRSR